MFAVKMWDVFALISIIGSRAMQSFSCSASRLFVVVIKQLRGGL